MRYKKIRGLKKKVAKISDWVEEYIALDINQLTEKNYHYSKVYVYPWDNMTLTDSEFPEPKGRAKREILKGLKKIYNSWKTDLDKLEQPYYLKIWLYEPRLSKSQVVCAIDEKVEHYKNLFKKAEYERTNSSFTNELSPDFKWESFIDEKP